MQTVKKVKLSPPLLCHYVFTARAARPAGSKAKEFIRNVSSGRNAAATAAVTDFLSNLIFKSSIIFKE